ncbi:hypothetical protein PsorP6_004985 [Peronosclerospora sorghi]|uniref:Uncharacterized protein n=1 Tax=Peronosclerospora sorghi TaxID=230839 RepID=A0ACC0W4P2_9STRA|nr:hypothetical protein PsorP6_004985 [Peronosclerospora sorghi]
MDQPSEIRLYTPSVRAALDSSTDTAPDQPNGITSVPLFSDSGSVDAPTEAVAAKMDVEDDSTAPPSATAAGTSADRPYRLVDVGDDFIAPLSETAAGANVDRPFRLVYVIRKASTLRRDTAASNAAQTRVETPKPLASDVEAIKELHSKGTQW